MHEDLWCICEYQGLVRSAFFPNSSQGPLRANPRGVCAVSWFSWFLAPLILLFPAPLVPWFLWFPPYPKIGSLACLVLFAFFVILLFRMFCSGSVRSPVFGLGALYHFQPSRRAECVAFLRNF